MPTSRRTKDGKKRLPIVHIRDVDGKRSFQINGVDVPVLAFNVHGDTNDPLVQVSLIVAAPDIDIETDATPEITQLAPESVATPTDTEPATPTE